MNDIEKRIKEASKEYAKTKTNVDAGYILNSKLAFEAGANSILSKWQESERWRDVKEELPSSKNGFVDELVIVRCRNKNKEDGIWVYDICSFDSESWSKRNHTWETITHWKPIK